MDAVFVMQPLLSFSFACAALHIPRASNIGSQDLLEHADLMLLTPPDHSGAVDQDI
jgi:hypothetical protein